MQSGRSCEKRRTASADVVREAQLNRSLSVSAMTGDTPYTAQGVAGMPDHERSQGFGTMELPAEPTVTTPDGSHVRELLSLPSGSAAHCELPPGAVSRAGHHRTVDEIWYILEGCGEMWRRDGSFEEVVALQPGLCLTIPVGISFQFRTIGDSPLSAFAVTMPPWPTESDDEWMEVEAHWPVQERVVGA